MTHFKMKLKFATPAALLFCCLSCISVDYKMGGSLIPIDQTYKILNSTLPLEEIDMRMADSLSGYSSSRITVGAVCDEDFGVTTRSSAITLIPMFIDKVDLGTNPVFKRFHFSIARDTTNVIDEDQLNILQNINVYELDRRLDSSKDFDTNAELPHSGKRVTSGIPVYNGTDSLSFNFSKEFGEKYLTITEEDTQDIDTYLDRFPGIVIETDAPKGGSGRINIFDLQLSYNSSYYTLDGNLAKLSFSSEYDGVRKDTMVYFYLSALDFYDIDSLLTNSSSGSFPQYCLNVTGHQTREKAGRATDKIYVEGGGGLKPVISAKYLKNLAEKEISAAGGIPSEAVINKASLVLPFEFPEDYKEMDRWPDYLSPTCRFRTDTTATFMSLTDSSSDDENQGDINRSLLQYAPDITYHMQELLKIDENDKDATATKRLNEGYYDIWFLIMANEVTVTENESSSELSDYYNYLAYSSYYNSMYGGYGGYSSYGYGGYGSSYSNYYTYAMLAAYASSSSTTTSTEVMMDKDRFYKAFLNGPDHPDNAPRLELTFSIPNEAE